MFRRKKLFKYNFEVPGKEDKNLKFRYKNKRGKYIFHIEGKKINKYKEIKNLKDEFFFNIELNQKKYGFKIKDESEGKITFANGIYTIKYQIEERNKKENF